MLCFHYIHKEPFENTVGKGLNVGIFSISNNVFNHSIEHYSFVPLSRLRGDVNIENISVDRCNTILSTSRLYRHLE